MTDNEKNIHNKWIQETENCTIPEYEFYIFLQRFLYLIHTKIFIFIITFGIQFFLSIMYYVYFNHNPKIFIFSFCIQMLVYKILISDEELIDNKNNLKNDITRLINLKNKLKNNEQ